VQNVTIPLQLLLTALNLQ